MARVRLGFLGGTFDPVHLGHMVLAETARDQLGLARVLFIPAGQPWRKADRRITAARHRREMLRLATADNLGFEVCDVELARAGASYSADTLEWLHAERPGSDVYFILGEDALEDLPNWRRPGRVLELATLAVARRQGGAMAAPIPEAEGRIVWLDMPLIDISASAVRERVRQGRSIRYLVPDTVAAYIREQGLYR